MTDDSADVIDVEYSIPENPDQNIVHEPDPQGYSEEYQLQIVHDILLTRREKPDWDEVCDLEMDPSYSLSPWNHPQLTKDEFGRPIPGGNRRVNSVSKHVTDKVIPRVYREQYDVIRMALEKETGVCPEDLIDLHPDLTAMQRRFILEYSQCHSAHMALKRMYGKENLSPTDRIVAYKLQSDPLVRSEIDRISVEALTYLDINSMQVLLAIAKIAFAQMSDYATWDEDGAQPRTLVDMENRGVDTGAIERIVFRENKNGKTFELKMYNKLEALQVLAKVFKMVPDQLEVKQDGQNTIYVDATESLVSKLASIAQRRSALGSSQSPD